MTEELKGKETTEEELLELCSTEFTEATGQQYDSALKGGLPIISEAINKKVADYSYIREMCDVIEASRGQTGDKTKFSIAADLDAPTWVLPSMGYLSHDFFDLSADEVIIPSFTIQAAKNWLLRYQREGRVDVLHRAIQTVAKALAEYEIEAFWRTIAPAATSSFDGAGILQPRPAPIYQLPSKDPASGYFSKELVNRMIVGAQRLGKRLRILWLSPEDLADIREWTGADIDLETRHQVFQAAGLGTLWGIELRGIDELGIKGKWNINGNLSEWGPFKGNATQNAFNDYQITHGNVLDQNGNFVQAGETQIYGFCEDIREHMKYVHTPYEAILDPSLIKKQQVGFFGWKEMAMGLLDARSVVMGVIDRHVPNYTHTPHVPRPVSKPTLSIDKYKIALYTVLDWLGLTKK